MYLISIILKMNNMYLPNTNLYPVKMYSYVYCAYSVMIGGNNCVPNNDSGKLPPQNSLRCPRERPGIHWEFLAFPREFLGIPWTFLRNSYGDGPKNFLVITARLNVYYTIPTYTFTYLIWLHVYVIFI